MTAGFHGYGAGVRVDVLTAERPTWRGLFHTWAFLAAIPAGVLLIVFADQPRARTAAAIYAGYAAARLRHLVGVPPARQELQGAARSCSAPTTR